MGSNGSYFLGWALPVLGIIAGAKLATVLLAMGLPILDVAWLIFYRWRTVGRPTWRVAITCTIVWPTWVFPNAK